MVKLENGKPLKNSAKPRKHNSYAADRAFRATAVAAGVLILCILASTAVFLLVNASPVFFSDKAKVEKTIMSFSGGQTSNFFSYVGPLVFGTVIASALALCIAYFVAAGIALFVSHYAPKPLALVLNGVIDLLASIPSVIYGLWGGLVLVPHIHPLWEFFNRYLGAIPLFSGPVSAPARTISSVAVVLAVMILPIITSIARDIFVQTPKLQEEAALALGATKWESIKLAVLPFGRSGLVSASMLGLGRALGETMAVLMILSPGREYSFKLLTASQHQTIAANIAAQFPEADSLGASVLIATGLILFVITFAVNFFARKIAGRKVK